MIARFQFARVKQHHAAPDNREIVFEFEIVEHRTFGHHVFEQGSQIGNVPLAVAEFVNQTILGFVRGNMEILIKSAIGRVNAKRRIEHQKRLAHRVHDVLRKSLDGFQIGFRAAPFGHIFHRQNQKFRVAARAQLARIEQHHAAPDNWKGVFEFEIVEHRTFGHHVFE